MAILAYQKVAESLIISAVSWGGGHHLVAKSVLEDSKVEATANAQIYGIFDLNKGNQK